MLTIKATAGDMLATLRMAGAGSLFDPVIASVDVKKKTLTFSAPSTEKTSFVRGNFHWKDWKMKGKNGKIVLNPELISEWIKKLFPSDELIAFEFDQGKLRMVGKKDTATLILDDLEAIEDKSDLLNINFDKNFLPLFPGIKKLKKVLIESAELQKLTTRGDLVYDDTDFYNFDYKKKGSVASVGSSTGKKPGIITVLDANVKNEFDIGLGAGFKETVSAFEGAIELYARDRGTPFWMCQKTDDYEIGYLLAPFEDS
jgi:hypothetical protein